MDRVVVVGLGRFGRTLVETLAKRGADVLAIDRNMEVVQEAADELPVVVQADATDLEALEAAGARGASIAVVAIGDDFETAVLATSVLREIGVERIIARANSEREARILRLVGASDVVFIEQEMGRRLAISLLEE
ncbi:MAG TPA: TrkA family potassium uptake protein [Fredinandcohnia sp.]|nr:TrkA family potassium uptake protein [Fredinandcohnia sp.]